MIRATGRIVAVAVLFGAGAPLGPSAPPAGAVFESSRLQEAARGESVEIEGYAEYRKGGIFIVDGQRVRIWAETEIGGAVRNPSEIELGFEVKAWGERGDDGVLLARRIEAKPNAGQMMETQAWAAAEAIEREWLQAGRVYETSSGMDRTIGDIVDYDDRVLRVNALLENLQPPYLSPGEVRIHVVESDDWNAAALANGALWIFTGLIDSSTDDELAIILGHELAHYTYEHSRRARKTDLLTQILAGLGAGAAISAMPGGVVRDAASLVALLGTTAFTSDYSRDLEDQADRVGLRYAHEAGYDVHAGPGLWHRFLTRYGQSDELTNFFLGSHSRPTERIENIEAEIALNYATDG